MKLGIMQPYFFPYIGYFQLIGAVDKFVIYDDVQWMKGGWINRNRILIRGQPKYITLPLKKGPLLLNINERELSADIERFKKKILQQIQDAYKKSPYFDPVYSLVSRCLSCQERNLSRFVVNSLRECCEYLDIDTPFILASELGAQGALKSADRVIDINNRLGADHYINSIGGKGLYDKLHFSEKGLRLSFIRTRAVSYKQLNSKEFFEFLSIVDVMMFNSKAELSALLQEYDLI